MFPLKERKIGGYNFGQRTSYSAHHLGVDYHAVYQPLYAPFNGRVERHDGTQGGITLWFYPDGNLPVMRFMHLLQVLKTGQVNEGDLIAVTGESGSLAGPPHLHLDISNTDQGTYWNNFSNFQDPEKFNWGESSNMAGTLYDQSGQVWLSFDNKKFYVEDPKSIEGQPIVKGDAPGVILIKQSDQDTRLAEQKAEYEAQIKQLQTELSTAETQRDDNQNQLATLLTENKQIKDDCSMAVAAKSDEVTKEYEAKLSKLSLQLDTCLAGHPQDSWTSFINSIIDFLKGKK